MNHRAEVSVDLEAIAHNISVVRGNSTAEVLAVVKANAYGHGLVPVAKKALESGATWLGVALLEEAFELRAAGITAPIIAWLTPPGSDFEAAIQQNIDLSIPSIDLLHEISEASKQIGKKARVHLEVDTGMTRGGILEEWDEILPQLKECGLEIVGLWTHFARADEPTSDYTDKQLHTFTNRLAELKSAGITPKYIHHSNSAASIRELGDAHNILRIGIALYGLSPDCTFMGNSESLSLRPAMSISAKLQLVKTVPAGSPVGYGGSAVTTARTTLGIVTMGYSDGIPRNADSTAGVTYKGVRAPIIGRVSMDQFVVDLGPDSPARAGEEVQVIGADGYSADDWAKASGTINYEIVTRIAARVPRIYA